MALKEYFSLIEQLNIDKSKIVDDLTPYYEKVRSKYIQRSKIERTWGTVENYVNALYWMKFIMKLDHFEMDELTGIHDFYKAYKAMGWYYNTYDFKECISMHKIELERLTNILSEYNDYPEIFNGVDFKQKYESVTLKKVSISRIVNNYGVENIEELFKQFYYLVYVAELNTSEIAIIYDKDRLTISKLLRTLNMNISRKEARKRIESHGRGNHMQSAISTKKKIYNYAIKHGTTDNKSENIVRGLIETKLYSYFDVKTYEFLVGVSSNAIISPREIDIPILIYNKATNVYYRYAVELDGNIWHEKNLEHDAEKEDIIKDTKWKMIRIWFKSAEKSKKNIENGFRKIADDVCNIIRDDIVENDSNWSTKSIEGF